MSAATASAPDPAAGCGDQFLVSDHHHQQAPRPRQTDVELLWRPVHVLQSVDAEDHHRAFEPLEAEDVSVELGVVVVKGLQILGDEVGLEGFMMDRMPFLGGGQRDLWRLVLWLNNDVQSMSYITTLPRDERLALASSRYEGPGLGGAGTSTLQSEDVGYLPHLADLQSHV